MKDIAKHKHTGLGWHRIWTCVFLFGIIVSLVGLTSFKNIDEYWTEIVQKHTSQLVSEYSISIGAVAVAFLWACIVAAVGWAFERILTWQTTFGWPRYFFYAFRFSEGQPIVGWTRISLDSSDGKLFAEGRSFDAATNLDKNACVPWDSDLVHGGKVHEHDTCYILYILREFEARQQNRPYREGLLRFRLLRGSDLKDGATWPTPSQLREEQYCGHQQAINKDGIWNIAYAESAHPKGDKNTEIEEVLTHDLGVRRQSLLDALTCLEKGLKDKI